MLRSCDGTHPPASTTTAATLLFKNSRTSLSSTQSFTYRYALITIDANRPQIAFRVKLDLFFRLSRAVGNAPRQKNDWGT